jgi:hypothetical protein
MAAIDTFKAHLLSEAATLTSTFNKYKCLALIDSWFSTWTAIDALRGTTTTAYSMNGRSVTRQSLPILETDLARLQREIEDLLHGRSMALVDASGTEAASWPTAGEA